MSAEFGMMIRAILPEIGLVILAGIALTLDIALKGDFRRKYFGWITAAGFLVIFVVGLLFSRPPAEGVLIWGQMLRLDEAGYLFRLIFLVGAALTSLFAAESELLSEHSEFFMLLVVSTLGMCFMASAADLIMLYLAMETVSIPMYVMVGFRLRDTKSVEAGLKYLLYGATATTVMLFGISLVYGFSGTTHLYRIAGALQLQYGNFPQEAVIAALMLMVVGFAFKISAAPFHFWTPDVYEGAPTPVAGFLSTASKAAGFAMMLRTLLVAFPEYSQLWTLVLGFMAAGTMLIGNLLAVTQKNMKRLLAYSSISQAGYILIGVAANTPLGVTGAIYYLAAYLVTNLAAFGIIAMVNRTTGSSDIDHFAGLSRRSPGLALAFLAALLSLGGIPPFAGFVGKLLVFGSAVQAGGWLVWLAGFGILNSVVSLYYYLNVLKVVYLNRSDDEDKPYVEGPARNAALVMAVVGIVLFGIVIAPLLALSNGAAASLWNF